MRVRIMMVGLLAGLVGVLGLGGSGLAQDKANSPTGTWKWTTKAKDGKERETVLKLKADGTKLTGTVSGGGKDAKDIEIEDGSVKDGEVKFSVTRMFKDQKNTSKYAAKVTGDVMKGTIEATFGGKDTKREFEAKRSKD
ncbi:hypothetical protein [Urbifossiella limnaea]|uniref:Uncharacterized protein n=1 Tax=Urbifossiella limnaea TaxID=2528023 RepID=A0A517XR39_9BACT|nr:hypothetical protein [Urbifossiella limnaea]QDU19959.1 hypothetical protein ETAA1_18990 [Urbifossiella limnaea]